MHKQADNRNQLSLAVNDKLRKEIEQLHESRAANDQSISHTVRFLLWFGLKHLRLYSDKKSDREQGAAMDIDRLTTADKEQLQAESGIYISKL